MLWAYLIRTSKDCFVSLPIPKYIYSIPQKILHCYLLMKNPSSDHSLCFCIIIILQVIFVGVLPGQYVVSDNDLSTVVEFLPGFHGRLPFMLHTGYIGVGSSEEVQLFYYFVSSESNPKDDPLILWLTGGPGCSSLSALLYEIGPLYFEPKRFNGSISTLLLNKNSLTKVANILFLDQPIKTGFSYSTTPTVYTDLQACEHVYEFLQKWLMDNRDFISNPFYLGGDSYSGLSVPVIAELISNGNEADKLPLINLKGYLLGNPVTFPGERNYQIPYAHGLALISDELYKSLEENCKGEYEDINPSNVLCSQYVQRFNELVSEIEYMNVLDRYCGVELDTIRSRALSAQIHFGMKVDPFSGGLSCRVEYRKLSNYWANDPSVQEALHVRKGAIEKWLRCRQSIRNNTYMITYSDSLQYHKNLSTKGYRSLIYSGDHDLTIPFQSTQAWIRSLNYSIVDDWRPWMVNGQVAGYTRSYSNQMTFATVKGGGHTAAEYKVEECFNMFRRWLAHHPL